MGRIPSRSYEYALRDGTFRPQPGRLRAERRDRPRDTGAARDTKAKVIAFANQKGGVAKTTTTLNLAAAFVESGHRALCVDLDPQANLTMSQGIDPDSLELSMYDVLVNHISIREVIRKREVDVACASIDLAGAEIAMSTQIGRERSLEKALAADRARTTTSSASTRRRASGCSRSTR